MSESHGFGSQVETLSDGLAPLLTGLSEPVFTPVLVDLDFGDQPRFYGRYSARTSDPQLVDLAAVMGGRRRLLPVPSVEDDDGATAQAAGLHPPVRVGAPLGRERPGDAQR